MDRVAGAQHTFLRASSQKKEELTDRQKKEGEDKESNL